MGDGCPPFKTPLKNKGPRENGNPGQVIPAPTRPGLPICVAWLASSYGGWVWRCSACPGPKKHKKKQPPPKPCRVDHGLAPAPDATRIQDPRRVAQASAWDLTPAGQIPSACTRPRASDSPSASRAVWGNPRVVRDAVSGVLLEISFFPGSGRGLASERREPWFWNAAKSTRFRKMYETRFESLLGTHV